LLQKLSVRDAQTKLLVSPPRHRFECGARQFLGGK